MPGVFCLKAEGGGAARPPDLVAVRAALALFVDVKQGVMIQGLKSARWRIHKGSDFDGMIKSAEEFGDDNGVYFSLNPFPDDRASPVDNDCVTARRWFLIDVDPIKPNKNLNSTDVEHEEARKIALAILSHLIHMGWPLPVIVNSGNGWHLLYRIDLPNTAEAQKALSKCLAALAKRFDNDKAHVDKSTHDARRITKLPGTWARKGPHTPDRPWRMATIFNCPEQIELTPIARIHEVGATDPDKPPPAEPVHSSFVVKAGAEGHRAYARKALESECFRLAFSHPGELGGEGRNNQAYKSAASMGELIGAGWILKQEVEDFLFMAAVKCGIVGDDGEKNVRGAISRGIAKGKTNPRKPPPDRNGVHPVPKTEREKPVIWRMGDLMKVEFPPPNWAVPGLMGEGLNILAGKPKLGKSWMALNLALTIAGGGTALGMDKVDPGEVLYLSLEDRERRVQDRARKLLKGLDVEVSNRLSVAVRWAKQNAGGLEDIEEWLEKAESPKLVIIDVWQKFRVPSRGQGNQYEQDYETASQMKTLMDKYRTSLLVLHHCKKAATEDVVDEISGTNGFSGAADGLLVLTRARNDHEGKLFISGRDFEEKELALEFDKKTFCWKCVGDAKLLTESKIKTAVLETFRRQPSAVLSPKEMAGVIGQNEESVRNALWRMANDGLLRKSGNGRYTWPLEDIVGDINAIFP